jgi:hypothetical protein
METQGDYGSLRRKPGLPATHGNDKATEDLKDLSPGERILEVFAQQVMPIVRSPDDSKTQAPMVQPAAVATNLDEHLADLAVAEAILRSAKSRCFEPVCREGIAANELWN